MSSRSRNVIDLKKATAKRAEMRQLPLKRGTPKPLRLRTRRRNKRILTFCICILCAAGAVGGIGAASHLQKFAVSDVSVSGAEQLSSESLSSAVREKLDEPGFHLFSRKNILLYPKSMIESNLSAAFPRIKEVSVARQSLLAAALVVTVEERKPYATWCTNDSCYAMDSTGFIYAEKGEAPEKSYVFHGGLLPDSDAIGQSFLLGRLSGMVALLDSLGTEGFAPKGLTVDSEKDFTIELADGPRILASFETSPADIIRNLKTALEADALKEKLGTLEYIDLRFGNRVYYK